jgi:hypothetical protein
VCQHSDGTPDRLCAMSSQHRWTTSILRRLFGGSNLPTKCHMASFFIKCMIYRYGLHNCDTAFRQNVGELNLSTAATGSFVCRTYANWIHLLRVWQNELDKYLKSCLLDIHHLVIKTSLKHVMKLCQVY